MISERNTDLKVVSNLQGEKINLGIEESSFVHIMSVLTDLYSDPEGAVTREYGTNAYDAHVEAGVKRPIEVSTPTPLAPFYRVRDFGRGLSVDDVRAVYSQYGASTKRQSNDFNGMLGLGCKSALTYADQFTVVSVCDGVRIQASVSRDASGAGSITIPEGGISPTTEESGVEIIVPAKANNDFERKARRFFAYWPEGSVLLNGKPVERVDGLWLNDRLLVRESDQDYLVMGNVAYPVKGLDTNLAYGYSLTIFADIGEVNFAPSREALFYNDHTKATLAKYIEAFKAEVGGVLQREIDKAATHAEAIEVYLRWRRVLPGASGVDYYFKGDALPKHYGERPGQNYQQLAQGAALLLTIPRSSHVLSRHGKTSYLDVEHFTKTIWLYGFDTGKKFTAPRKRKIDTWREQLRQAGTDLPTFEQYVLLDGKPDSPWIDPARVHPWADIDAIKLTHTGGGSSLRPSRPQGSYDAYVDGAFKHVQASELRTTNLFYRHGNRHENYYYDEALAVSYPQRTVVCLPGGRIDKFERDFPSARKAYSAIAEIQASWVKKLTHTQKLALQLHDQGEISTYKRIDPARVNDAELAALARAARVKVDALIEERKGLGRVLGRADLGRVEDILEKRYPLASSGYGNTDHVYLYINAVHAARQAGDLPPA